jgi:hypothetical protein
MINVNESLIELFNKLSASSHSSEIIAAFPNCINAQLIEQGKTLLKK